MYNANRQEGGNVTHFCYQHNNVSHEPDTAVIKGKRKKKIYARAGGALRRYLWRDTCDKMSRRCFAASVSGHMHLFSQRKQRDQINPLMFIWSSLYPLASISPRSWHQLMCVALKSNLYHLNESKAPRRYSRSPISTHQLLPLYSLIIWAGLRWLVGLLMWCRLLVFPLPTGRSPDFSKDISGKSHNPLAALLLSAKTMRWGSYFQVYTRCRVCWDQQPSTQCVTSPSQLHL